MRLLQRYVLFELLRVGVTARGFDVHFTRPADAARAVEPQRYRVERWRYRHHPGYGSPKLDKGEVSVARAIASPDYRVEGSKLKIMRHMAVFQAMAAVGADTPKRYD